MQEKKTAVQKLIESADFDKQKFDKMKEDEIKKVFLFAINVV